MRFDITDFRIDFDALAEKFRSNSRVILLSTISILLVTAASCAVIFLLALKGSEKVMVPDVTGKDLSVAMLKMQAKELYPKIQLKYSDTSGDRGTILDQSPSPGSIVKAGRRINLVVSRGVIVDRVENFVGQNIDDVKIHLQALFTSSTVPLLSIKEPPLYRFSVEPAGTILAQNPAPDTQLSAPVAVELVVSRGPENDRVSVPAVIGLSISGMLSQMARSNVIFDFTARAPEGSETAGTVVSQLPGEKSLVAAYARVAAVIAMPVNPTDGRVYGIFTETLPLYPYPFLIKLESVSPAGERSVLASFKHPGGSLSVPYAVADGTTLVLTILNKEVGVYEIHADRNE